MEYSSILVPQDLHIHTVFSSGDSAVAPEQTVAIVAQFRHARIIGISDHIEYIYGKEFDTYKRTLALHRFHVGVEVQDHTWVDRALELDTEYYIYHCRDKTKEYKGAEKLLSKGLPVIIAHPQFMETDLSKVPEGCIVEINNRYVWRGNWRSYYTPYLAKFRFIIGSDAHQPFWLNQHIARSVAKELGVEETILFSD